MRISKVLPILFFAIVAAACPPAFGQSLTGGQPPPAPAVEGPKGPVVDMPESSFNFGKMYDDQTYVHDFVIKNAGDAPLEIKKVVPG